MNRSRSNIYERGPPDPILVCYPGSGAAASSLAYSLCLHERVPGKYELWILNAQGLCEVHPFARVKLFDDFTKDFSGLSSTIRKDAVLHSSDEHL